MISMQWRVSITKRVPQKLCCMQVVYTHYSTAAPYAAGDNVDAKWVRPSCIALPVELIGVSIFTP